MRLTVIPPYCICMPVRYNGDNISTINKKNKNKNK